MAFSSEEKKLILIQSLYFFAMALADVFVTVFFFSHGTIQTPAWFQLIRMVVFLGVFLVCGWVFKKVPTGTIIKTGLFCMAVFFACLYVLKERAITYLVPLSVLNGVAIGMFWSGYNLNQYIYSNREKRISFFGSTLISAQFLQALAPTIGGSIIALGTTLYSREAGYGFLFLAVAVVLASVAFLTGKLPEHERISFSISHFFSHKRTLLWKKVLLQHFLLGMYDLTTATVTGILFFLIVKREFLLGLTQTTSVAISILGTFIAIRMLKKSPKFYWVGTVGTVAGLLLFARFQTKEGIFLCIGLVGFTSSFIGTWMPTVYFHALDSISGHWKEKYHLLFERDTALALGRILSYSLLILFVQPSNQVALARLALFLLPIFPLLLGFALTEKNLDNRK
jgi:YQGE family putative transporter